MVKFKKFSGNTKYKGDVMGFSKINSVSLTDLFVQQIENMILSGELEVGQQLPAARELCALMGVSRPVVTAGLIELEKLGFVEIRPRQGAFVCDYRRKGTLETLVAVMRYNGGAMRENEVASLLEVRRSLESLCMSLVIEKATDADMHTLSLPLEKIKEAKTPEDAAGAVFSFHHEAAVISGNMLLPLMYYSLKPESLYLWTLDCKVHGKKQLYEQKLSLYRALLNRDKNEALRLTNLSIDLPMKELDIYVS